MDPFTTQVIKELEDLEKATADAQGKAAQFKSKGRPPPLLSYKSTILLQKPT